MKFEIKNKLSGMVIFSAETENFKLCIDLAIKSKINLSSADLSYADLSSADLRSADLSSANLLYANLRSADLSSADLRSADLLYANLRSAKNNKYAIAVTRIAPLEGEFIGWKKCRDGIIIKLTVPKEAKRSNAFSRKCRAEFVRVEKIYPTKEKEAVSQHNSSVIYRIGEVVRCDKWDDDFTKECSGGIHFFMTREEAENY